MNQLLSYLFRLCLFKAGPQDAPASEKLVIITAVLVAVSYALTSTGMYEGLSTRVLVSVSQVLVFGVVVWLVLKIKHLENRWIQTLIALFGAAAVFQFVSWPLVAMFDTSADGMVDATGLPQPLWLHVFIGVWYLAVMSNVLRQALDTSLGRGVAAAMFCQLTTVFGLILVLSLAGVGSESG
ncbi:MAG: hypothetical protein DHS20C01_01450 [marine bacterium B5-7]|nr:MAG: hypothetical protein DHS20C01_01450 [marine bacterium B5-7]